MLERTGHGVLSSDRRKAEPDLSGISAQQCGERLAPAGRILTHSPEIFLEREADLRNVAARSRDLRYRIRDSPGSAVVRAPGAHIGIKAVAHERDRLRRPVKDRNFRSHCLRFSELVLSAVGHEDGPGTDGCVEHLNESAL